MPSLVDQFGRPAVFHPTGTGLYEETQGSAMRLDRPALDTDLALLLSRSKHRAMISDARWIFTTFALVSGAIRQKHRHYVSANGWSPRYIGEDDDWETQALPVIRQALAADTNTGLSFSRKWTLAGQLLDIDGSVFVMRLRDRRTGFPRTQVIEAHRVGSRATQTAVKGGAYDGARIINGIVYSDDGREVAYQVLGVDSASDRIISAEHITHVSDRQWFSENRPFPAIAYAVLDWYDIKETRNFEKIGQKVNSALTIIETNETGQNINANPVPAAANLSPSRTSQDLRAETFEGGLIRYLKSGTGDLKAHESRRPGDGWLRFDQTIVNGAMYGIGWRSEMMDLSRLTGAGVRGFADNINRVIRSTHEHIAAYAYQDLLYKVAALIDRGDIPEHPQWDRLTFPAPARFDTDRKHTIDSELAEVRAGRKSMASLIQLDGQDPDQVLIDQARYEAKKRAIAAEYGLDPVALGTLSQPGDLPGSQDDAESAEEPAT